MDGLERMYPVGRLTAQPPPQAKCCTYNASRQSRAREALMWFFDLGKDIGQRSAIELEACASSIAVFVVCSAKLRCEVVMRSLFEKYTIIGHRPYGNHRVQSDSSNCCKSGTKLSKILRMLFVYISSHGEGFLESEPTSTAYSSSEPMHLNDLELAVKLCI
jgi:hypothetical protein